MGNMATKINSSFRVRLIAAAVLFAAPYTLAQSAPSAVPVPFSIALAGMGNTAASTCSAGIAATDGTNYGDGCVGTLARLSSPQGAAVDKFGNVYVGDYSDRLVRVVYNGGASVAALITAANSGYAISASRSAPAVVPVVGNIYTIAGVGVAGPAALTVTATDGKFECANYAATGQPEALNSLGDGCPAASAPIGPRDVTPDADGNLFLTDYTDSRIRVLCVNCAATTLAAQLIVLENPGVTPMNGAMYTVAGYTIGYRDGYIGFGNATTAMSGVAELRSPTTSAVSSSDDVFIADNLNSAVRVLYNGGTAAKNILVAQGNTSPQLGFVYTIAGAGCVSAALNKTGSTQSANSCLSVTPGATGSAATADTAALGFSAIAGTVGTAVNVAWAVYQDANGNVYYTDQTNARVKVIYAGIAPPLTFPNAAYPTLQTGYSYSFAGQGTAAASGVPPSAIAVGGAQGVGGDANGNIFFMDYNSGYIYETYAQNGLAALIGGGNFVATSTVGASCNGGSSGPTITDNQWDGCPLTQVKFGNPRGPIVADASGNLYFGDSIGVELRKFTYNPTFPATATGATSAAQPYAFTFFSAKTLTGSTFETDGAAGSSFSDAGGDTCASGLVTAGGAPGTTCVVNVAFTPQRAGLLEGAVEVNSAGGVLGSTLFSGTGNGAGLAVDPGNATTTGTGLVPEGIAVDGADRVVVADGASKSVIRYTAGAPATVAAGFTAPSGVAIDGAGNIFVADATANTVTEVPITGTKFTLSSAVSKPHGLATDGLGNLYVADTGNNRVLVYGAGGILPSVVGFTGLSAPLGVAVDASGALYAVDSTHVVKLTRAGVQSTVANVGGTGVAVDAAGDVLVTTGLTLVEYPASGGAAVTLSSSLIAPQAVAMDISGNVFIADSGVGGYLELQRTVGYFKFVTAPSSTTINLTSIGNMSLTAPTYAQTDSSDFAIAPATTNGCSGALAPGSFCSLTATFNPNVAGTVTDAVSFTSNAANAPVSLTLTGTTVPLIPTLSLAISSGSIAYGNTETLVSNVSGVKSTAGSVTFSNGATVVATVTVDANGNASYSYQPAVGSYSITATFTPTGGTAPTITSATSKFTVTQATPTISLSSSAASGYAGLTSFTLTATVKSATTGTPTGSVTFFSGTTSLGTVQLSSGAASLTTMLVAGSDPITAVYAGDSNFVGVTSTATLISVAAGFGVTATSTALSFQPGYQEAQTYLTINPGGRSDTLTFACQGLPAKLSCAFSPSTLALAGVTAPQTVQLLVSNSGATASLQQPGMFATRTVALATLPFAALLLFGLRRRRLPMLIVFALLAMGGAGLLSGCGSTSGSLNQSSGTYPFTVTVSSGATTLQTMNFTVTVP
jgi:hypothetical protein